METVTKNKKALAVVVLLVLALVAYFTKNKWMPMFSKDQTAPAPNTTNIGSSSTSTNTTLATATDDTILKRGSKNDKVKELQQLLNQHLTSNFATYSPLTPLVVDGDFGSKTEARLLLFTNNEKNQISINQYKSNYFLKTSTSTPTTDTNSLFTISGPKW